MGGEREGGGRETGGREQEPEQESSGGVMGALGGIQRQLLARKRLRRIRAQDVVSRLEGDAANWQAGIDALDPSAVQAAGGEALADWTAAAATSAGDELARARRVLAQLGLRLFRGNRTIRPLEDIEGDPAAWLKHTIERSVATIHDVNRIAAICSAAKTDDPYKPRPIPGDAQAQIVAALAAHTDLVEMGFIQHALQPSGSAWIISRQGAYAPANVYLTERIQQHDEQSRMTHGGRDKISPELAARIRADCDRLYRLAKVDTNVGEDLMGTGAIEVGGVAVGAHDILASYPPEDRERLLQELDNRKESDGSDALTKLVHHAGGATGILQLIHEAPGYASWVYDPKDFDSGRTQEERFDHAVKTAARLAPAAPVSFLAGFYHGLGHVPLIGGIFTRAGDNLEKVALKIDSKMGVDQETAEVSNAIAGGFGEGDSFALQVAAGGELEATEAVEGAEAVEDVELAKAAYDAVSTAEKIARLIAQVRDAMEDLDEAWSVGSRVVTDLVDALVNGLGGGDYESPEATRKTIQDVQDAIDQILRKQMGQALEARYTEAGAEEDAERRKEQQYTRLARQPSQKLSLPPEMRPHIAALKTASVEYVRAKGDPAAQDAARKKMLAAQRAIEGLRGGVGSPTLARAKVLEKWKLDRDAEKKQAKKDAAAQRKTSTAKLKYVGHQAFEAVKKALIDAIVAFGRKLNQELANRASAIADPSKKPEEKKSLFLKLVTAAVTGGLTEGLVEGAQNGVRNGLEALLRHFVEENFPELGGVAKLADEPINTLLEDIKKKLHLDERLEDLFEPLVRRALGKEEVGKGEGKAEGGASSANEGEG